MITEEEKEEIIQMATERATERALLALPLAVTRLINQKIALEKIKEQFYKENPNFKDFPNIVISEIEKADSDNPGKTYEEILKVSTPEIKRKIESIRKMDTITLKKPESLTYRGSDTTSDVGAL
jgi:hypothetical protein